MQLDIAEFYEISGTPRLPETGAIALHYWASTDQVENLRQIQNDSGNNALLTTDFLGNTPLHYAAICSAYNAAAMLTDIFPSEQFYNCEGITPAHIAAQRGDIKMLEILIHTLDLMYLTSKEGWTPLHFAIFYQRTAAVRWIMENCDAKLLRMMTISASSVLDPFPTLELKFLSPLDLAKHVNNCEIIDILDEYHALPSLHCAILNRDFRAISYYLFSKKSYDLNLRAKYRDSTALHWAVAAKQYEICHSLLENKAKLNILDCDGLSPLDIAVAIDSSECVAIMVERCTPKQISDALFLAADLNRAQVGLTLLKAKFDPKVIDEKSGDSFVIRLIKRGWMGHIEQLLANSQIDLRVCDKRGATALHYAAAAPRATKVVDRLTSRGLYGDMKDANGTSALSYFIRAHRNENEGRLPSANPNLPDNFGMTPSTYAIVTKYVDKFHIVKEAAEKRYNLAIKDLLESSKNTQAEASIWNYMDDRIDKVKVTQISLYNDEYIKNTESEWVKMYLEKNPSGCLSGASLAHISVLFGADVETLKLILDEYPQLIDTTDSDKRTPLHLALSIRRCEMVDHLMSRNADLMAVDVNGNTIWHYADDVSTLNILNTAIMQHSRGIDVPNKQGDTPIHLACKRGLISVLKILAGRADPSAISAKNHAGEVPLDCALLANSDECISFLHAQGVENRLITALTQGDINLVDHLLNQGYPINSADQAGNTALHIAAADKRNGVKFTRYLISKGCDPNILSRAGISPLHVAAKEGHSEIIRILLSTNMNITKFPLENQPFLCCSKDSPDYMFLFQYWKRQEMTKKLFDFMCVGDEALVVVGLEIEGPRYERKSTLVTCMKKLLSHIMFVSDKVTMRRLDQSGNAFNFMTSLHHLLSILTTIDFTDYQDAYRKHIKEIAETGKQKYGPKGAMGILHFIMFPFYWMNYIADIVQRLEPYMIAEIDNLEACRNIIRKLSETASTIKTELTDNAETRHQLTQVLGEEPIHNLRGIMSPLISAQIEDIVKHSTWCLQIQMMKGLREFFGKNFCMPRSITWKNKSNVEVAIVGEFLIIGRKDSTITIPLFFLHTTFVSNPDGYSITSPIGSFRLTFGKNSNAAIPFKLHLLYVQTMMNPLDEGMLHMQKAKSKMFWTLSSYELSGSREVHMRMMMVRADNESECRDVCYSHIAGSLAAPPTFFNVMSKTYNGGTFC